MAIRSLNKYLLRPVCLSGDVLDVMYTEMKRHNSFPMQPGRDRCGNKNIAQGDSSGGERSDH